MVKKTVNWSIESMPKREDFILCLKRGNGEGVGGGSGFSIEISGRGSQCSSSRQFTSQRDAVVALRL